MRERDRQGNGPLHREQRRQREREGRDRSSPRQGKCEVAQPTSPPYKTSHTTQHTHHDTHITTHTTQKDTSPPQPSNTHARHTHGTHKHTTQQQTRTAHHLHQGLNEGRCSCAVACEYTRQAACWHRRERDFVEVR